MKRIYLDSNILIAHFATDRAEESKKKRVESVMNPSNLDMWGLGKLYSLPS